MSKERLRFADTGKSSSLSPAFVWVGIALLLVAGLIAQIAGTWLYSSVLVALAVIVGVVLLLLRSRSVVDVALEIIARPGTTASPGGVRAVVCRYHPPRSSWVVELATLPEAASDDEPPELDSVTDRGAYEDLVAWARPLVTRRGIPIVYTTSIHRAWRDAVELSSALRHPLIWISDERLEVWEPNALDVTMLDRLRERPKGDPIAQDPGTVRGVETDQGHGTVRLRWPVEAPSHVFLAAMLLWAAALASAVVVSLVRAFETAWLTGLFAALGALGLYGSGRLGHVEVVVDPTSLRVRHGRTRIVPLSSIQLIGSRNETADHLTLAWLGGALEVPGPHTGAGPVAAKLSRWAERVARSQLNTETKR